MKKLLLLSFFSIALVACGGEEESTEGSESEDTDTTAQEVVPEEPEPTPSELAYGRWLPDADARSEALVADGKPEMTDEDKAGFNEMFKNTFLDLNDNGTFEMNNPREEYNGTGLWEIPEDGSTLTLTYDGDKEPMSYNIALQNDAQLHLRYENSEDGHTSRVNWEFKKK